MKNLVKLLMVIGFAVGCQESEDPSGQKPEANPDHEFVGDRADGLSNQWTTLKGSLNGTDTVMANIDYPDWFHGYTLELQAGQSIDIQVAVSATSVVRFYGPATHIGWDGRAKFGRALFAQDVPSNYMVSFDHKASRAGTYMVVVGPKFVWRAQYAITTATELRCGADSDCPSDMMCEHNGVVCITTPCDVSYNVCVPAPACEFDEDCTNSWCGYTEDGGRICKGYVAEGEQCGGFRMAHLVEQCPPELICAAPYDIIADIPGTCAYAEVTVAELVADPRQYDGRVVLVRGALMPGHGYCTKMACPDTNPCCNSCGSQMLLVDSLADSPGSGIEFRDNGEVLGCSGNECNFMDACNDETGNTWTLGTFHHDPQWGSNAFDSVRRYDRPTP